MAKYIRALIELDSKVSEWLDSKGIDPDLVGENYTVERDHGLTKLHITLYADDFMVTPPMPLLRGNEHGACQRPCSADCPVA